MLRALIAFILRYWLAIALITSAAMLAVAHAFETFGGFEPCHMCLQQRTVYWVAIGVSGLGLLASAARAGRRYEHLFGWLLAAVFLVGVFIAVQQAGAEWKFWPEPETCTGARTVTAADLNRLLQGAKFARPRCDQAAWRLFGLSMAGWNALISLKLVGWSVVFGLRRRKAGQLR